MASLASRTVRMRVLYHNALAPQLTVCGICNTWSELHSSTHMSPICVTPIWHPYVTHLTPIWHPSVTHGQDFSSIKFSGRCPSETSAPRMSSHMDAGPHTTTTTAASGAGSCPASMSRSIRPRNPASSSAPSRTGPSCGLKGCHLEQKRKCLPGSHLWSSAGWRPRVRI